MARNRAFEVLYREFYVRVFGLCRRLLNSQELAEDATQETFIRAYTNFGKFDSGQPFWQWIATIANNYCMDRLRLRHRTEKLFGDEMEELDSLASKTASGVHCLIAAEDITALNIAVSKLSDKYRVPLVLVYYNQFSYNEVAKQLNISVSHVGVLVLRAKKQLRATLASAGKEHSS